MIRLVVATTRAIPKTRHHRLATAVSVTAGFLIGWVATRPSEHPRPAEDPGNAGAEQVAMRRLAMRIAEDVPPEELYRAFTAEAGALVGADCAGMVRYEDDGTVRRVATWQAVGDLAMPERWPVEESDPLDRVAKLLAPATLQHRGSERGPISVLPRERGARSSVGVPIVVDGRVWGSLAVHSRPARLPPDTKTRLSDLGQLLAAALSNSRVRAEVQRLAEEQAALRRIATLVAAGSSPPVVFDAVTAEVAELLRADQIALVRFEPGPEITVLAHRGRDAALAPVGTRIPLRGESVNAIVHRTGQSTRLDSFRNADGSIMQHVPDMRTGIGTPIVVDGRLWGTITGGWLGSEPAPPDAEHRMTKFAELLALAIANADSRAQLTASRARMVAAGDDARRRVVRDLHDGAQQRLVHTLVTLKLAARALDEDVGKARELVADALEQANRSNEELRELARGILPAVLTRGGLRAGVDSLVVRLNVPVAVDLPTDRFSAGIEASAYFVIAEALTNVIKHARAEQATVRARVDDGMLHVEIGDDGVGGADATGNGLVGIADRVSALGGHLAVESPIGAGTVVTALLPVTE
jgi:signal transduction histidine kinase